jgi:hypothetical protein
MPSLLLCSHERIPCRDHPGKSRAKPTPTRGSLTLITDPAGLSPSKIAPTTPAHIYGRGDDFKEQVLIMPSLDVPVPLPLTEDMRDVAVENIELVGTTVEGVVRVPNVTYEKWIVVRFTIDNW